MAFEPFNLGQVLHDATQLKGMQDNATMQTLQRQYLGQKMTTDAAAEGRAKTEFDQQQQLSNTKLLNMAAAEVANDPNSAARWDPILKSAIPGWEGVKGDPAHIQAGAKALFESTSKALQAYQAGSQNNSDIPSNVREYSFYQSLPPEKQKQFLEMKRSMNPYNVVDQAGGKGVLDKRSGEIRPLTSAEQEAAGQATVAGAKAGATEAATTAATARAALPDTLADLDKFGADVQGLLDSPGFNTIYGLAGKVDPRNYIAGTDAANSEARRGQLDSEAFGIAIKKMVGLGSLSNAEGSKVSSAFTRATNGKISADEARKAWGEVQDYLVLAKSRAQRKAVPATQGGGSIASGPKPGTVEDGYRFKGGDPGKRENWEPAR